MDRMTEIVVIRGEEFEVRELSVRELLPLVSNMSAGTMDSQMPIVCVSVYKDGNQLGEEAWNLPGTYFFKLLPVVLRVNSLDAASDGKGEDGEEGEPPGNA